MRQPPGRPALSMRFLRPFWVLLGMVALALGAIGIVLPVLPTTPFVLLAAFAFAKGSPKLAAVLEGHRVFGPMIAEWRAHGAIRPRYKRIALTMMVAALTLSWALALPGYVLALQAVCMSAAAGFILTRPNGVT